MLWFKKKDEPLRNPQLMAGQNDYVFRRSRTLTGTVSSQVAPAAAGRGQLKTDRLKLHELHAHLGHVLRLFVLVIAVCAGLSFLVVNFALSANVKLAVEGSNSRSPDIVKYQTSIYAYYGDHPMERFGFLLRPTDIETYLKSEHAELAAVEVFRDWYGGNARVVLSFRKPLLTWKVGHESFYVDGQGTAFHYNHYSEPSLTMTDQSGIPSDSSGVVASSRFIRFLGRMVGALNGYGKVVVSEVILPASTREVDLKVQGRDYVIKANSDRDPLQQAEDIASAIAYMDSHRLKPQYVDLRVAHKAFYK